MSDLPSNVYRLPQRAFDAIPGVPWVYWIPAGLRCLFETLPRLGDVAHPTVGLQTGDNFRFLRYWWQVGQGHTASGCRNREEAQATGKRWFPYMKGGAYRKWYGNQEHVVNWQDDGEEMRAFPGAVIRNPDYYFREGVTWTDLGASGFSARISPSGFVFDVSGSCAFPQTVEEIPGLLSVMNADSTGYLLGLLNPTLHYQVGDLARLPVPVLKSVGLTIVGGCIRISKYHATKEETTFDFIAPPRWKTGLEEMAAAQARLAALEAQIDDEVYRLYGISEPDRAALEAELAGGLPADEGAEEAVPAEEDAEPEVEAPMTTEELAVRWISYAVGIVLGRFRPGLAGELGSAVYRREDFAVGSLPAPDEAEFGRLVGPAERFAYVDADGGRHVFPVEVEAALWDLAVPDGIAVLDEGHPRDLPALVEQVLQLMLDWDTDTEHAARNTREVVEIGAGGGLRKFLEKDFFTRWHLRWYRKHPVYWPLQSARRSYGFVLFHERVERATLYVLQRDYLDHKLNGLRLQIDDLQAQLEGREGRARKQIERQMDAVAQVLDELAEFAATMERIVRAGYEPVPDWIDDGVILRLAPLWELVPLWKSEPKKAWERLQQGDFDWSHIAMRYWPVRVREACKANKSFAIAHGHPEWYQG